MMSGYAERAHQVAREVLAQGGYTIPVDVIRVAQDKGIAIRFEPLEEGVSGMLVVRHGHPVIGINKTHHPNRQRFSIAHELGHFLLHGDTSSVFVDAIYFRDHESAEGSNFTEIQANAFAAELLMPESVLRERFRPQLIDDVDDVTIRRLSAHFGVSSQALTIRLTSLGLIAA